MTNQSILARCEAFLVGFEDDATQEGVIELLNDLRVAMQPPNLSGDPRDPRAIAEEATQAAINAGCKLVQDALGITSGDVAGMFWTGGETESIRNAFDSYVNAEVTQLDRPPLAEGLHPEHTGTGIDPETGKPMVYPKFLVEGESAFWLEHVAFVSFCLICAPLNNDGTAVQWDDAEEINVGDENITEAWFDATVKKLRAD